QKHVANIAPFLIAPCLHGISKKGLSCSETIRGEWGIWSPGGRPAGAASFLLMVNAGSVCCCRARRASPHAPLHGAAAFNREHHVRQCVMSSSRASALRSVFGAVFFNLRSLSLQARGSLLAHQRSRRQRLSAQCRNEPSRSHCARRTKS